MQGQRQAVNTSGMYDTDLRKNAPFAIVNIQFLFSEQMTQAPTAQDIACMFENPEETGMKREREEEEETVPESPPKKPNTESDEDSTQP